MILTAEKRATTNQLFLGDTGFLFFCLSLFCWALESCQNYFRILQLSKSFSLYVFVQHWPTCSTWSTCTLSHTTVPLKTTVHISHLHCICRSTASISALNVHDLYYTCSKWKMYFCFLRRICRSGGCPVGQIWRLWAMHWSWTTSRGRQLSHSAFHLNHEKLWLSSAANGCMCP